jgi:hypothetical protein
MGAVKEAVREARVRIEELPPCEVWTPILVEVELEPGEVEVVEKCIEKMHKGEGRLHVEVSGSKVRFFCAALG